MDEHDLRANSTKPVFLYVEDEADDFMSFRDAALAQWPDAHIVHVDDFTCKSVARELKRCDRDGYPVDVIILDLLYKDRDLADAPLEQWSGLRLLKELRAVGSPARRLPIVACTMFGDRHPQTRGRGMGVAFLAYGGTDFIEKIELAKPPEDVTWHHRLRTQVVMSRLTNSRRAVAVDVPSVHGTLEGNGRFIDDLRGQLQQLITNGTRFLCLHGETGVGKGKAVGYIKSLLGLSDEQTAEIQLSTIPESLLEGFLFGHCKGAFTGATDNRAGALENKKLIYLDEFQRISLHLQAKLLRVLRERFFFRIGDPETRREISPNAIFVVSLDAPPDVLVRRNILAPDIAGRLPLSLLEIRPLRTRQDEIEQLVNVFIARRRQRNAELAQQGSATLGIDPEAARAIARCGFDWPYNIGQLESFVEHICDTRTSHVITSTDVQRGLQKLMGSELELALRILRRYAFDRTLTARAWGNLGRPGTTYLRDDRNMNTFCVRRVIARIAADVSPATDRHESRLMVELLGPERFDSMLHDIVRSEIMDLRTRLMAVASEQALAELVRVTRSPSLQHLLLRIEAPSNAISEGESLTGLAKLFNYTKLPEELFPGIGLLLVLDPQRLSALNYHE